MNSELQVALDVLRGVPESEFNMGVWWCGTCGCAIGHYCHARPDSGLVMTMTSGPRLKNSLYPSPFRDIATHFEITTKDARMLFSPSEYTSARLPYSRIPKSEVIARLEAFIASHGDLRRKGASA